MAQGISVHCFDIARGMVAEGLRVAVYTCEPVARLICERLSLTSSAFA
jgi:hypothetical protein